MITLALIGGFLLLLVIGVPVAISLAGSSLIYVMLEGVQPHLVVLHRMIGGIDSFPLLAIPFFIMAGSLMNSGGVTNRIYDFALALVGWLKGGLGHVNVVGSVIFAGMSGTAVADAGGLGNIEIKAMRDHGYSVDIAVGITGASSTIGPIIPPSLPFVIYGVMANASIGKLFAAGVIPGLVMALTMMIMVTYYAHTRGWHRDARFSVVALWRTFKRAFLPLLNPIILVGGMTTGVFTPTEAAIAATAYAIVLGLGIYRTLSLKKLIKVSMETAETTAIILLIVAGASIFGYLITLTKVTDNVSALVLSITTTPWVVLLLVNIFLLIVRFMETRLHHHPGAGAPAPDGQDRRGPGPLWSDHGPEPDDRAAHAAGGDGPLHPGARGEYLLRADNQGLPTVSRSTPGQPRAGHLLAQHGTCEPLLQVVPERSRRLGWRIPIDMRRKLVCLDHAFLDKRVSAGPELSCEEW
jgi:tripartite ATP-independent transporter DctM subunit